MDIQNDISGKTFGVDGISKTKKIRSSSTSLSSLTDDKQNEEKPKDLNAYSLKPVTVPPFVLDSHFKKLKLKDSNGISKEMGTDMHFKDPFLISYDNNWDHFIANVGNEGCSYGDDTHIKSGYKLCSVSNNDYQHMEKMLVQDEVFTDLDGSWNGGERLNGLFNEPLLTDYDLKNPKDKRQLTKYLTQLKSFYYNEKFFNNSKSGNNGNPYSMSSRIRRSKFYWNQFEQRKKQQWFPHIRILFLDNQYLPLSLRILISSLCLISLSLAVKIYQHSQEKIKKIESDVPQQPSTIMAICLNSIAIIYLIYIGYDEFAGKPLGLRNPLSKLRLILLDLLFIIFSSANLSLTFNALYDNRWVCTVSYNSPSALRLDNICRKQKALAAFLFLGLVMWVITFAVSILRVVEKVSNRTLQR